MLTGRVKQANALKPVSSVPQCNVSDGQSIHKNNASTLDGQSSSPDRFPWVTLFQNRNNRSNPNRFEIVLRVFPVSTEIVIQRRSIMQCH